VVPTLPVLRPGESDHPEWRAYLRWVYGDSAATAVVDLNAFSWFYQTCPLKVQPVSHGASETLAPNTAWTCNAVLLPECQFQAYGFFVTRGSSSAEDMRRLAGSGRLEVLRVRFPEMGVAWFYGAVGSGVFLNLDALPTSGSVVIRAGLPEDWMGGVLDYTAAEWMRQHDCALLVMAERFADSRVEIVARAPGDGDISEDATCPFSSSPAAFSTGLAREPCECRSDGVSLINCRAEVWAFLRQSATSYWTVIGIVIFLAALSLAILLQLSGH
jgi:hypothetical protein